MTATEPDRDADTGAGHRPADDRPLRVGLVGAGPWATLVHAPTFAGDPRTTLAGVWARRPEAAQQLASAHAVPAFDSPDALFEACDVVAFAVPPDVQAELGVRAARAGRALFLEKPVAIDLAAAERLVHAVEAAGVPTLVDLTFRFTPAVRALLDGLQDGVELLGGRGHFLAGGFVAGPFATPWRLEHGPLLDLGPHVVDVLDAALGPVVDVRAAGGLRWVGLLLEHASGLTSEVALSGHVPAEPARAGVEVHTSEGVRDAELAALTPGTLTTLVGELVAAVRSAEPHPLDVRRGLHLQRAIERARTDLRR